MTMQVRACRNRFGMDNLIELRLVDPETRQYVKRSSVELVSLRSDEVGIEIPPVAQLDNTQGQALMDQLWDCGIRPSEGSGSAGQMAATIAHLNDMRRLVFKRDIP